MIKFDLSLTNARDHLSHCCKPLVSLDAAYSFCSSALTSRKRHHFALLYVADQSELFSGPVRKVASPALVSQNGARWLPLCFDVVTS